MTYTLKNGGYVLDVTGLPQIISGKDELLQNARLRLELKKGSFIYDRELGSGLHGLSPTEEHRLERAAALAVEALTGMPGVRVQGCEAAEGGGISFQLSTPFGKGEVEYGAV